VHPDEIAVSDDAVRCLIADQFPQWAGLPVRRVAASGTVNAIVRIGDGLAARFPLRPADAGATRALLRREADASALLARHCPVPAPRPVALGEPGCGYPLPWSMQTWLPGTTAVDADPAGSVTFAHDLAALVAALRAVDTGGRRFDGDNRGGDLRRHDAWVATCLRRDEGPFEVEVLRELWNRFRDLPRESPDAMTHGDLIPGNVLVRDSRLAGVLDGGGFGPADPALDLVAAWHLLDGGPRAAFREDLGCDDLEWARGTAWAFEQALGVLWYGASNPAMNGMGRRTLRRIVTSPR
jgi:aminoglycoside phosphotransferase (APT) family kinase protein